jgi:hypothetical protein
LHEKRAENKPKCGKNVNFLKYAFPYAPLVLQLLWIFSQSIRHSGTIPQDFAGTSIRQGTPTAAKNTGDTLRSNECF